MKRKILLGFVLTVFAFLLAACWNGEVKVETTFNNIGGGERIITFDVIDESLSDEPILKRDKTGNVENNQYIEGGVIALQAWFEANAPEILTVHPMETDGYYRYFTLSYTFESWQDFLAKYEILVNASPEEYTWNAFLPEQLPTMTVVGKKVTIKDSRDVLKASLDWAVDGIYNSIYKKDVQGAANHKNAIYDLFNITMHLGTQNYELENYYDDGLEEMVRPVSNTEFYEIEYEFNPEVTFDLNGGSIGESTENVVFEVNKGEAIPASQIPLDLTKEGHTFKFWSLSKDEPAAFDFETIINEDTVLYAIFESLIEKVTVTFDLNGGAIDGSTENISVEVIKDETIPAAQMPLDPAKEGHTFKFWSLSKEAPVAFDFDSAVSEDITLYAIFETTPVIEKVTVTFDLNGGMLGSSTENVSVEVTKDETIPAAQRPLDPTKVDHTFKFWSLSKDAPAAFDFDSAVSEDIMLYAIYETILEEKITVTFDLNGGTIKGSTDVVTVEINKDSKLDNNQIPANPTKDGYTFSFWATSKDQSEGFDFTKEISSNIVLYAIYSKNIDEPTPSEPNKGLSTGAKAAIIIGSVVAAGAIVAGGFVFFKKKKIR